MFGNMLMCTSATHTCIVYTHIFILDKINWFDSTIHYSLPNWTYGIVCDLSQYVKIAKSV